MRRTVETWFENYFLDKWLVHRKSARSCGLLSSRAQRTRSPSSFIASARGCTSCSDGPPVHRMPHAVPRHDDLNLRTENRVSGNVASRRAQMFSRVGMASRFTRLSAALSCFSLNRFRKPCQSCFHFLKYFSFLRRLCESRKTAAFARKFAIQTKTGEPGDFLFARG